MVPGDTTMRFLEALSTLSVIASFHHFVHGALPVVLWGREPDEYTSKWLWGFPGQRESNQEVKERWISHDNVRIGLGRRVMIDGNWCSRSRDGVQGLTKSKYLHVHLGLA